MSPFPVSLGRLSVLLYVPFLPLGLAADVVDVTDIGIFSQLAPCAASALSWAVNRESSASSCSGATQLQSCVCSNSAISNKVLATMTTDLTSSCGGPATDDINSAKQVYTKFCNPDSTITFPSPTTNIVNAYITELSEMQYMAPCAQSGLSAAVMGQVGFTAIYTRVFQDGSLTTSGKMSKCPKDADRYAPCVCSKPHVTSSVSNALVSSIKYYCSNTEDLSFAQTFYHEYCAMNNGTTSFAVPSGPPGDMTYYISALPQFQSLRGCAQTAVGSAFEYQTMSLCAPGPQALASCICIKSGMKSLVSSSLTSSVKYYCSSTATADVTSALSVLEYYCSAAESKVVATVAQSVAESYPTVESRTGPTSSNPTQTSSSTGSVGGGDNSGNKSSDNNSSSTTQGGSKVSQTAIIAAGVLGAVVAIGAIGALGWFIRRKKLKKEAEKDNNPGTSPPDRPIYEYHGTPELGGDNTHGPMGVSKPGVVVTTRPELGGGQQQQHYSELAPQHQYKPELGDNASVYSYGAPQELASPVNGYQPPPFSNGRPVQELPGMGWQSGPVETYEMDAQPARRQ
ncbi:unnamed protein product [Clonostachys byssicola]|uniref:Uncharacterized protein n=1 Tax=Clonostachys byssicola TaxID=160290 RepID=A0A9N9UCE2_9HYPO|nr:unnamed protein product [Clonostachys byssicola]